MLPSSNIPATIARDITVPLLDGTLTHLTGERLTLAAGDPVTILYTGADQDGWNGEYFCALITARVAVIDPGDVIVLSSPPASA